MNPPSKPVRQKNELDSSSVTKARLSTVLLDLFNIKPNESGAALVVARLPTLSPTLINLLAMKTELVSDDTGSAEKKWEIINNTPVFYDTEFPTSISALVPFALIASPHQGQETDAALAHLLSASKLDPNLLCEDGMSLLYWCANYDRAQMAGILIDAGADTFLPHYAEGVTEKGEPIFETSYDIAVYVDAIDTAKVLAAGMARQRIRDVLIKNKDSVAKNG